MKLKIKPTKNTIALRKVKFRKESDFNKFLKIVSKNTKELERIKLPSKSDVKKKSGFNLLPILALGALIAALAALNKNKKSDGDISTTNIDTDGLGKLPLPTTAKFPKITKTPKLPGSSTTSITKTPTTSKTNILTRGLKTVRNSIRNLLPNTKKILTPRRTNLLGGRNIKNITPKTQRIKNFISELSDSKNVRTIKEGIKTARFLNPTTLSNPYSLAGSLIMMDIMKGHGLSEEEWENGPGTLAYELEYQRKMENDKLAKIFTTEPGTGFKTEAEKQKNNINKEIDQLIKTRSQLDPKDRRTYQHLTTKIEELLVQSAAITPKALEQKFIKDSFTNPVIFYPIDSESSNLTSPLLNAPNFYSPPQSQSQTGNNVIDGESDVVNISELFLLNKLSH